MEHLATIPTLRNNENFKSDNPFPYHEEKFTPGNYMFEFMRDAMGILIQTPTNFGKFVSLMDPSHQFLYPEMLQVSGNNAKDKRNLLSLIDHMRKAGTPVIAISKYSPHERIGHMFVIVAAEIAGKTQVYTYDSLDYYSGNLEDLGSRFDQGSDSQYENSGTVRMHSLLQEPDMDHIEHINLGKNCKQRRCIQYYLGKESCATFSSFFASYCIWRKLSVSNLKSVLLDAVQSSYEFTEGQASYIEGKEVVSSRLLKAQKFVRERNKEMLNKFAVGNHFVDGRNSGIVTKLGVIKKPTRYDGTIPDVLDIKYICDKTKRERGTTISPSLTQQQRDDIVKDAIPYEP